MTVDCSHQGCRNRTTDPTGRCYLHVNAAYRSTPNLISNPPTLPTRTRLSGEFDMPLDVIRQWPNFGPEEKGRGGVNSLLLSEASRVKLLEVEPDLDQCSVRDAAGASSVLPHMAREYDQRLKVVDGESVLYPMTDVTEEELREWHTTFNRLTNGSVPRSPIDVVARYRSLGVTPAEAYAYISAAAWADVTHHGPWIAARYKRWGVTPQMAADYTPREPHDAVLNQREARGVIEFHNAYMDAAEGVDDVATRDRHDFYNRRHYFEDDWDGAAAARLANAGVPPRIASSLYRQGLTSVSGIIAHHVDGVPLEWALAHSESQSD